jgi:hypothetical protein
MKRAIETIRQKVMDQAYTISSHANEEMSDDNLTAGDVEQVLLTGRIRKRFTRDPSGERYEVIGEALDDRPVAVARRLLETGWLRIITVYAIENGEL